MKTTPTPNFTPEARERWEEIPESSLKEILENVRCVHCGVENAMRLREGRMDGTCLILTGTCKKCRKKVVRLIEGKEKES